MVVRTLDEMWSVNAEYELKVNRSETFLGESAPCGSRGLSVSGKCFK